MVSSLISGCLCVGMFEKCDGIRVRKCDGIRVRSEKSVMELGLEKCE